MTELSEQVKWEKEMLSFGIARFRSQEAKAKERGAITETNAGAKLLKGYLAQVSQHIQLHCTGNNRGKYAKLIRTVDPDKLAMFALNCIISSIYEDVAMASVVQKIGTMIEDELKFTKFYIENPAFFDSLQRDLDNKNSNNYRHRHRVLTHTMNKQGIQWLRWDNTTVCGAGELVLRLTLESTDLVKRELIRRGGKTHALLVATPEVHEWIRSSNDAMAVLLPDRMPCLIKPVPWTDPQNGGYHTPRLRMSTPLVKIRRGQSGDIQKSLLVDADITKVTTAINAMQDTAWRINVKVLETMQEVWDNNLAIGMPDSEPYTVPPSPIPRDKTELDESDTFALDMWKQEAREIYSLEQKRRGLVLGISRTMRIGQMLKDKEEFYYVYQCDFRGRVYAATSGVSPQGSDHAKGVLEFKTAEPLGKDGFFWLGVHGANKFGYDKVSYADRDTWAQSNIDNWRRVAEDPISNRTYWKDADKPYQFLAWVLEYVRAFDSKDRTKFESRIPIALDGSCNGLQHFSAMLRDTVGGSAVNLVAASKPADIYQEVADVCTEKLRQIAIRNDGEGNAARNWLSLFKLLGTDGMSRKLSKTPVMTLPYGSTQQACTSSIFKWYKEQGVEHFPVNTNFLHCIMLSKLLWQSISEVVIAARAAMNWIQECSSKLAKKQHPLHYTSELGFPVFQGSRKVIIKRIDSKVGGTRMQMRIALDQEALDIKKQRQGSSPNLVHHIDATHMMMCINEGVEQGITSFAMIHDDFGVHANKVTAWHKIIREQFIKLHEVDLLAKFKQEQETLYDMTLPDTPEMGDLDLSGVLKSKYFFG